MPWLPLTRQHMVGRNIFEKKKKKKKKKKRGRMFKEFNVIMSIVLCTREHAPQK